MEEKNNERHSHTHRRRRRPNNGGGPNAGRGGNGNGSPESSGRSGNGGGNGNGGYTKANQNPNRSKNRNNAQHSHNSHNAQHAHNQHSAHNAHNQKKQGSANPRPRKKGYQPDTGKDAIRAFVLGTFEENGSFYVFSFDRGTYRIQKGAVPVIPEPEESEAKSDKETAGIPETTGVEGDVPAAETGTPKKEPGKEAVFFPPRKEDFFDKENAEELLMSRDKVLAYQTWNEIKRPKKAKGLKAEAKQEE